MKQFSERAVCGSSRAARAGGREPVVLLAGVILGLLSGSTADAQGLHAQKISQTEGGFTGTLTGGFPGELNGHFGTSTTAIDVDGDGRVELIVGEPGCHDGGAKRGALWVLFLGRDGRVRAQQKISQTEGGGEVLALEDLWEFGFAVEAFPGWDLFGDGKPNVEVGMPGAFGNRGSTYRLSLNADGTLAAASGPSGFGGLGHRAFSAIAYDDFEKRAQGIPGVGTGGDFRIPYLDITTASCLIALPNILTTPLEFGDRLGMGLDWIGDLNADGIPELAVASPGDDDGGVDRGAIRIFSAPTCALGKMTEIAKISSTAGGFGPGLSDGDELGHLGVAGPGDLDGDGLPDLVVGAPGDDDGGADRGAIYRLLLNADGTVKSKSKLSSTSGNFTGALADGDRFGHLSAHDLNNDGVAELIVGAPYDDDGSTDAGAIWILWDVPQAGATSRNGSGINPVLYTNTSPPVLGALWSAEVAHAPTAALTLVYGFLAGTTGPTLAAGELLVDPTTPRLFRSTVAATGASDTHTAQVPSDVSLAGFFVATQALVLDPGTGPTLTNAVDLVVGGV